MGHTLYPRPRPLVVVVAVTGVVHRVVAVTLMMVMPVVVMWLMMKVC